MIELFFRLVAGHFLCDYPLQGDFIGQFKCRKKKGCPVPWWHLMAAHSFIHGGAIILITGRIDIAIFETIIHFFIDCLKCEGWTDINIDQSLHIICKIGYVYIISVQ